LERDPDTAIITVDDDVEYPPTLVERLVNEASLFPRDAVGFTGWCLNGYPASLDVHHHNEDHRESGIHQPVHVLEGYRGVLYRRGFFEPDIFRHLHALDSFQFHDDILLSGYLASRGVGRRSCWFDCGQPPPQGSPWRLLGQAIGLHTGIDWFDHGAACLDYWQNISPRVWAPIPTLSPAERLQLYPDRASHKGCLLQGAPGCRTDVDVIQSLHQYPWPWPNGVFAEILALNAPTESVENFAAWLEECHRILRPEGVLKFRAARSDTLVEELNRLGHSQWRWVLEHLDDAMTGTFVSRG
jgi:hypothetical protein